MTGATFLFPRSWGAEFIRKGEVRFRIWAPGEQQLWLELAGKQAAMGRSPDGWFELLADGVEDRAPYRFILADGTALPDPAARAQADDVHGASLVIDPTAYEWQHPEWRGRPWHEAVIYELHVGTFTEQGTFRAAIDRLPHLKSLGVTAIELMPVAQFGGRRGWGYDGVLLYSPHCAYGTPEDMKALVDAAHGHGLMVLLDVVYNHFGPDGNYLGRYAPDFFHAERHTPWGGAIAYERPPVRQFIMENALYWLEEFQLDGLRLDAVDNVVDEDSETELLIDIAQAVRATITDRHIHLTTEDNRNITRLHERENDGTAGLYSGEWNDDFHNVAHVIATGEAEGYYEDFRDKPFDGLARALAEGYVYQGEHSPHMGHARGEPSAHLPPAAFVDFLQNHDQIGNRALGERLNALAKPRTLELLQATLLLSPHIPLLFMGEEYGETRPFLFFTDFQGELAIAVREGRRREFAAFGGFGGTQVPDPNAFETFANSRLDWSKLDDEAGRQHLQRFRQLLELRHRHIVPLLATPVSNAGQVVAVEGQAIAVDWNFGSATLQLRLNLADAAARLPAAKGAAIFADPVDQAEALGTGHFSGPAVLVALHGSQ